MGNEGPPKVSKQNENPENPGRRDFLKKVGATVGAAALGGMPGVAKGAAENFANAVSSEKDEENAESAESLEEVIAHYEATGEVLNPEVLYEHMRQNESFQYTAGVNDFEALTPERVKTLTSLATEDIRAIYESLEGSEEDPFRTLRQAIEVYLDGTREIDPEMQTFYEQEELRPPVHEEAVYNRSASSINDVLESKALQCRSGTHFFNQMATKILPQEELDKLVVIYTEGHLLPGYESAPGEFTGLEMTANVKEAPVFREGSSAELGSFRVTRALPATIENLVGKKLRPGEVVLLDEVDPAVEYERDSFDDIKPHEAYPGEPGPVRPEMYSFGTSDVTAGDKERPDLKTISYKKSQGGNGRYSFPITTN